MGNILFVGAGNMGQAIIGGLVDSGLYSNSSITIYEINQEINNNVKIKFGVSSLDDLQTINTDYSIVIFAIKPQVFKQLDKNNDLINYLSKLNSDTIFVSIMAGMKISDITDKLGNHRKIVRTMPNTPALIRESITGISFNPNINEKDKQTVVDIFKSIGETEIFTENQLNAVTGLSGSGPAFVFAFIEALTQGGVYCGLTKNTAEKLAVQTVKGASMMLNGTETIENLRHAVTSPGGTTIEGLFTLEKGAFRATIIDAVKTAKLKADMLS